MPQVTANTDPREVFDFILHRSGQLVYDVGANGGYLASVMADNFETVVAIEPCKESYDHMIERNTPNVKPLLIAASDHNGYVTLSEKPPTLTLGELFTGDSLDHWGPDIAYREVPCFTLDSLAKSYGYPDFVKIDTEGHEALIMDGAHEVFEKRPDFCIEIHSKENGDLIKDYLGYALSVPYTVARHHAYRADSAEYHNHFWLLG